MPSIYGTKEYFERFPRVLYAGRNLVNISRRVAFLREVKQDPVIVGRYRVKDGETPWSLAQDFYGSPDYHWLIIDLNNIVDPILDWPKGRFELDRYIQAKYGDARFDVRTWTVGDREFSYDPTPASPPSSPPDTPIDPPGDDPIDPGNDPIDPGNDPIDPIDPIDPEPAVLLGTVGEITNEDYEEILNEERRNIIILRPEYLGQAIEQFEALI